VYADGSACSEPMGLCVYRAEGAGPSNCINGSTQNPPKPPSEQTKRASSLTANPSTLHRRYLE
jgi:hypothetical protein